MASAVHLATLIAMENAVLEHARMGNATILLQTHSVKPWALTVAHVQITLGSGVAGLVIRMAVVL